MSGEIEASEPNPSQEWIRKFMKDWDDGKHQLSPEDEKALEKSMAELFRRIRESRPCSRCGDDLSGEDKPDEAENDCKALSIGRKWFENSSLEKWFPITAEELTQLKADNTQLLKEVERLKSELSKSKSDGEEAWNLMRDRTDQRDACQITIDRYRVALEKCALALVEAKVTCESDEHDQSKYALRLVTDAMSAAATLERKDVE